MSTLLSLLIAAAALTSPSPADSVIQDTALVITDTIGHEVIHRLTRADFQQAADELGVDVATIMAVVEIEAGKSHNGFHAPGEPLINFDLTMFRRAAAKRGINLNSYRKSHSVVFNRPNASRYGSHQAAQHERLRSAMAIDSIAAIDGAFWGMFQIGGFNWSKCGAESRKDFLDRMSRSEHEQLELFVNFIKSSGMDKYLRKKDWAGFALRYNGKSYARRGYHTRLANAYNKYLKKTQ